MNRETELHFASVPTLDISRCKLTKKHDHKTSFNTGDIIPIYVDDIIPGTTVKMKMASLVRMMTPLVPVADNAYMDIMFYFVPNRLIWTHWINFMGENDTAPWIQETEYEVPQIRVPDGGWAKGSLADYFGLPTKVYGDSWTCSVLPFRAYCAIYNSWFRDENLETPLYISLGDSETQGKNKGDSYDEITDSECGAAPVKAAKFHDYFTSALPSAQKGPAVNIPLGNSAPIIGSNVNESTQTTLEGKEIFLATGGSNNAVVYGSEEGTEPEILGYNSNIGLAADLSNAVGATVNQLRQSFAIQKFYERAARGGSRYIETILSHFRVTNPDFRMQRPEYMGGVRIPINMNQVVQTDATGAGVTVKYDPTAPTTPIWEAVDKTPQGNLAAYSATAHNDQDLFTHSFTEHGILMGLCVIRTEHTYQQGINKMWLRKNMFDYYWPELANLGEQIIENRELYLQGTSEDTEAFGYQERWAEYRYKPSMITGELRSNYEQSLDVWHYGDDYSELPKLGSEWIKEPEENIARTLAVLNHDQFFGDFYFEPVYTLPMPLYSVPGLIDHH